MMWTCMITGVLLVVAIAWLVHRQRSLKLRAHLMQEAIRNRDFTFRLPTDGLLPGERAMQEALNLLGQDIRQQISQNEVESWERLTRVLTHEIMNATAPIASISQSMLGRPDVKGTPLEEGIRAIFATSRHLNAFIDSYRKLSQLQEPVIASVDVRAVATDVAQLYPQLSWTLPDAGITVSADSGMLRQILVNMAKNAAEAGAKRLWVEAGDQRLRVSNDGEPIPAENRASIFVPFFSTKRGGSGVGLSLSRRMMVQQGGMLELADQPQGGYHTTFILTFSATAGYGRGPRR